VPGGAGHAANREAARPPRSVCIWTDTATRTRAAPRKKRTSTFAEVLFLVP